MNLRGANLTKERNFCTTWPWIHHTHVGIETVGLLWNELATSNGSYQVWAPLILKTIAGLLAQQNPDTKQGNKLAQNGYWLHTWRLIGSWWWRRHGITKIWGFRCNWPPQGDSINGANHHGDGNKGKQQLQDPNYIINRQNTWWSTECMWCH